jgi:Ca2+-binding EF-hand superfamily protein
MATNRTETIKAEASREDEIYKSVLSSSATSLASVLDINQTLMSNQSENSQKLFDLANTLVVELRELREVVRHNTEVTETAIKQVEDVLKKLSPEQQTQLNK